LEGGTSGGSSVRKGGVALVGGDGADHGDPLADDLCHVHLHPGQPLPETVA